MILDRFDDNDLFLEAAFSRLGTPDLVKMAAHVNDIRDKNFKDFALVRDTEYGTREFKYPVMDAGNAIASAVYFNEFGHNLPEDQQKLAAENISTALSEFGFEVPDELTKTAAMELGYTNEAADMTLEAIFGLTRERSDKQVLNDYFEDCTPRGKQRVAWQVKEASLEDSGIDMDYARDKVGSDLEMAIWTRKMFVVGDEETALDELLTKAASVDAETLINELTEFDLKNQLAHLYGEGIPNPVKSVLGTELEKTASEFRRIDIGDDSMLVSEFEDKLSGAYDALGTKFGDELVTQLKASPEVVYNSLPDPHKAAIANIIGG